MPTYEYECTICGYHFEEMQKISEPPLQSCPECGGAVKRLISGGVGVIFKGSGFYVTDSRNASKGGAGKGAEAASRKEGEKEKVASATGEKKEKKSDASSSTDTGGNGKKPGAAAPTSSSGGS